VTIRARNIIREFETRLPYSRSDTKQRLQQDTKPDKNEKGKLDDEGAKASSFLRFVHG
jgi:hypothetical protein